MSYNILAKALQKRLQSLLLDIIDEIQIGFLSMRYILDSILVQAKIIKWSKELHQNLILLKQDFKKAYDTLSLPFLFSVMQKLGVLVEFLNMVQLLFKDAEVSICINGPYTHSFPIMRVVRQGCFLIKLSIAYQKERCWRALL